MKNTLKKIVLKIKKLKMKFNGVIVRYSIKENLISNKMKIRDNKNTLIIVPHADDELLGAYNYIKSNVNNITLFFCNLTGSNHLKDNKDIRFQEFISFCKKMQCKYFIANDILVDLNNILNENEFKIIMLPSYIDWHKEHRLVNDFLIRCVGKSFDAKIIWYQISVPILHSNKSNLKFTIQEQKEKEKVFLDIYNSQKNINLYRFQIVERIFGQVNGDEAAEIYLELDYQEYIEIIKKLNKENYINKLNKLKENLNDIRKLFNNSRKIYQLLEEEEIDV